jgi:hypothetical protein
MLLLPREENFKFLNLFLQKSILKKFNVYFLFTIFQKGFLELKISKISTKLAKFKKYYKSPYLQHSKHRNTCRIYVKFSKAVLKIFRSYWMTLENNFHDHL